MQLPKLIFIFSWAFVMTSCKNNVSFEDLNGRWALEKVETFLSEELIETYLFEDAGISYEYFFNDSIFIIRNIGLYKEDFDETHRLWLVEDTICFERLSDFKSPELKAVYPAVHTVCTYHSKNNMVLRTQHKEDMYSTYHLKRMEVESEIISLDDYRILKTD